MVEDIATCVTALGVLIGVFGLRAARIQRLREFETFYVQRYWAIMDRLSIQGWRGEPTDPMPEGDEKAALAYLRLCEDQLELRRDGWITTATRKVWSAGLRQQLTRWPFNQLWADQSAQYPTDFTLLRKHSADRDYDPLKIRWIRIWSAPDAGILLKFYCR